MTLPGWMCQPGVSDFGFPLFLPAYVYSDIHSLVKNFSDTLCPGSAPERILQTRAIIVEDRTVAKGEVTEEFPIQLPIGRLAFKLPTKISLTPRSYGQFDSKKKEHLTGGILQKRQQTYKSSHSKYLEASNEYNSAKMLFWLFIALTVAGAALAYSIDKLNYKYFLYAGIIQTIITFPCIGGLKKLHVLQDELNRLKKDIESCGMRICYVQGDHGRSLEFYQSDSIPDGSLVLKPYIPIDFEEYKNSFR